MSSVTDQPPTAELPRKAQKLLQPGTKAPDFKLNVAPDKSLKLGDLAGKPVVLAFYPADWSPVCGDQLAVYSEALPEFEFIWSPAPRPLGRRGLVPRGVCRRTPHRFPAALRLRTEGRGSQAIWRLSPDRRLLRARAFRDRP